VRDQSLAAALNAEGHTELSHLVQAATFNVDEREAHARAHKRQTGSEAPTQRPPSAFDRDLGSTGCLGPAGSSATCAGRPPPRAVCWCLGNIRGILSSLPVASGWGWKAAVLENGHQHLEVPQVSQRPRTHTHTHTTNTHTHTHTHTHVCVPDTAK